MKVNKIELTTFRNYKSYSFTPNEQLNIITGSNGIGKTNLVEAIYYLNLARGFKNKKDSDLVNEDANEFLISADVEFNSSINQINIYFNKAKNEKKIFVNGKPITKLVELNKYINVMLFIPSMSELFKNTPQDRRDYLNLYMSKVSEKYYENLKEYTKLLKERNLTLKQETVDKNLIRAINKRLIPLSKLIVSYRFAYVQKLNSIISAVNDQISNKKKKLELIYLPVVKLDHEFENNLKSLYENSLDKDIKFQTTSIGVHKEDFLMNIDGKDISVFGSQAENRLAVVSLVLSSYFALKEGVEKPIVILDDVLSELDEINQERLIKLTTKLSQVFITSTETTYKEHEKKITEE
jgi:DNA replication and repair protein RecF